MANILQATMAFRLPGTSGLLVVDKKERGRLASPPKVFVVPIHERHGSLHSLTKLVP